MPLKQTGSGSRLKVTEADIRRQIVDYLEIKGWLVIPNIAGKLFVGDGAITHPGIADLTALRAGRTVWIEVKRPGTKKNRPGTQKESQKVFQRQVEHAGGEYILAFGIEDLQREGI